MAKEITIENYEEAKRFCEDLLEVRNDLHEEVFRELDEAQNKMNEAWNSPEAKQTAEQYMERTSKSFKDFSQYVRELCEKVDEYNAKLQQANEEAGSNLKNTMEVTEV